MSDPTAGANDGAGPFPPPPPPPPKTKKSEEAQRRRAPKNGKRVFVMLGLAGAVFAAVGAWIAMQPLPYVTHREILELATAVEATRNSEQLLRYFDRELFVGLPDEARAIVTKPRDDARLSYTFLTVADERTQRPRLLFRLHHRAASREGGGIATTVVDYQEMVADRRDGVVKIVDLRSLAGGDVWLQARRQPSASPPPPSMTALGEAVDAKDQRAAVAAFQALSAEERGSAAARLLLLKAMDTREADGFEALSREVRTWFPENLAPPFRVLFDAQFVGAPIEGRLRDDVRAAIGRIQVRIPDDAWLGAFVRAMTATPAEPK